MSGWSNRSVSRYKLFHPEETGTTLMIVLVSIDKILPSWPGSPPTVRCPSCEMAIRITTGDCPACGAKIAIECRDCGNTIETQTEACPDCGCSDYVIFLLE